MKRSNECFKCRNRFCSNGVITTEDNGELFNEVACPKHTDDLYSYASKVIGNNNGVLRSHVSTTGTLSRRILKEELKEVAECLICLMEYQIVLLANAHIVSGSKKLILKLLWSCMVMKPLLGMGIAARK